MSTINKILILSLSLTIFGCSTITKLAGAGAEEINITLYDLVKADLGGTAAEKAFLEVIFKEFGMLDSKGNMVTYVKINEPAYDDFFKASARLNALVNACKVMTTHSTKNLKKFAEQRAARLQGKMDMKEISDKPFDEWTEVEHAIFMKQTKSMEQLDAKQGEFFIKTAATLKLASMALGKGIIQAKDLLPKGQKLISEAKNLKPLMVPKATAGVKSSLGNLKSVVDNAPKMAEGLVILAKSFTQINN